MKTKSIISLFVLLLFFIFVPSVFAVSITVDQAPAEINNSEFTVQVTVTGASSGQNYLKAELFKDGTTNYFGETNNGNFWYEGSDGKQYFPITIVDSKTPVTSSLSVRMGTPTQTEYGGPGTYKLRIKRYTSSGNAASSDQQAPIDVQITYNNPTPTSTPTPIKSGPTPIPTPTATIKPTNTPTPTKTPTPIKSGLTPIKTPTPSKTPTPVKLSLTATKAPTNSSTTAKNSSQKLVTPTLFHGALPTAVLGASTSAKGVKPKKDTPSPTIALQEAATSPLNPAFFFIGFGIVALGSVGALLFKNYRSSR